MARNEEKHYGRLNRLILLKEKEEYEKHHPERPRLDSLYTVEEIQKWLPSIKRDLEFYLKKSQVTCYSDHHIEECRMKVIKLEKEFKAFVRKIKQLTPGTLDAVPWTNRAYKRKNTDPIETKPKKDFVPIACPILKQETHVTETCSIVANMPLMDEPLCFNQNLEQNRKYELSKEVCEETNSNENHSLVSKPPLSKFENDKQSTVYHNPNTSIVNYDYSSDSDCS